MPDVLRRGPEGLRRQSESDNSRHRCAATMGNDMSGAGNPSGASGPDVAGRHFMAVNLDAAGSAGRMAGYRYRIASCADGSHLTCR